MLTVGYCSITQLDSQVHSNSLLATVHPLHSSNSVHTMYGTFTNNNSTLGELQCTGNGPRATGAICRWPSSHERSAGAGVPAAAGIVSYL